MIPFEVKERLTDKVRTGDELEVDVENNVVKNLTTNREFALKPLGDILPILQAGNLFEYAKQTGMMSN